MPGYGTRRCLLRTIAVWILLLDIIHFGPLDQTLFSHALYQCVLSNSTKSQVTKHLNGCFQIKTCSVKIVDDPDFEADETFLLRLTQARGTDYCEARVGEKNKATITISNHNDGEEIHRTHVVSEMSKLEICFKSLQKLVDSYSLNSFRLYSVCTLSYLCTRLHHHYVIEQLTCYKNKRLQTWSNSVICLQVIRGMK